jgi:hypothetical protein
LHGGYDIAKAGLGATATDAVDSHPEILLESWSSGLGVLRSAHDYILIHRLSDIFTALLDAGLQIVHFKEYEHCNREETYAIYEGQKAQLPMCYTLAAMKR